jgi:hypothetical protein
VVKRAVGRLDLGLIVVLLGAILAFIGGLFVKR